MLRRFVTIRLPEFLIGPPGVIEQNFDNLKSSESPVTWSFSPRYEFSDTTSAYLRVATGFRPGGPNVLPPNSGAPATYDSDELTNYEVGIRTGNESGSFSLDVAAFFLDWEDIQLFQVVNDFGVNANGGTAESKGIEFTATARAEDGLSFSLTGAYIDAELTEDTDPDGAARSRTSSAASTATRCRSCPSGRSALSGDYEWSVFGDSDGLCRRPGRLHGRADCELRRPRRSRRPHLAAARARQLHDRRPARRAAAG